MRFSAIEAVRKDVHSMNQGPQYFTVSMLEEYLRNNSNGSEKLNFRELIDRMREEGLLLPDPGAYEIPTPAMEFERFFQAYARVPFDASPIFNLPAERFDELDSRENTAFPPGQSVFCRIMIPRMHRPPRDLEYFQLFYISQGKAQLQFEEDSFELKEGDICVLPPRAPHALHVEEGNLVLDVIIRSSNFDSCFGELLTMSGVFSGFFRESLYGMSQPNFMMLHTKPRDSAIQFCFQGLGTECLILDKHSNSCAVSWVKLLLSIALRSCDEKVEIFRFPTGGNPRADCGEILQYIQQNYRTVRLSTLAKQFHYNETYLSRMLQNYAHQSFTEIVREIRMNRAVEYLTNSSLRVHEIAGLVGYSSVDHFSRAFKSMYGVSPQRYRRENRKQ